MKKEENLNLIDLGGSADATLQDQKNVKTDIEKVANLFFLKVVEQAQKKQTIQTGEMISERNFNQEIERDADSITLKLFMIYYADYIDQGVQGVSPAAIKGIDPNKNAPNSPFKFKNLGMPEEVRKKFAENIGNGKIKISDKYKVVGKIKKYGKEGLEKKSLDTPNTAERNEIEANRMAFLIKAFGIKTTNFIEDAWKEFKKDLGPGFGKAAKAELIRLIKKVNK